MPSSYPSSLGLAVSCLLALNNICLTNQFDASYLTDLVHYHVVYKLHVDAPIEEIARLKADAPERVVAMKTSNDENYECVLPPNEEDQKVDKITEYKGLNPAELIQILHRDRLISTYAPNGYWAYDIAHGRYVLQYHQGRDPADRIEYTLGHHREDQVLEEAKKFDPRNPPKVLINNLEYAYYPVTYKQGTTCDLVDRPRQTTVQYVCYELSSHVIHSVTEISTCTYEIIVLTNILCRHPSFQSPIKPENEITCYAGVSQPTPKPSALADLERQVFVDSLDQFSAASDHSTSPYSSSAFNKIVLGDDDEGDDAGSHEEDDDEEEGNEHALRALRIVRRRRGMDALTDDDLRLILDFWTGKSCFIGGQGYWKYEVCYKNKVTQFHATNGKRDSEIVLGEFDAMSHTSWFVKNKAQAVIRENEEVVQVSNYYGNGDYCDKIQGERAVEVRLRCRTPLSNELPSIVLLTLTEPSTCRYVVTLESLLLCEGLQMLDVFGLIMTFRMDVEETQFEDSNLAELIEQELRRKGYVSTKASKEKDKKNQNHQQQRREVQHTEL